MLSVPHLIIIFIVALVVFGPEKLPELARTLGRVMAEFRRATGDLRMSFEDHLRDIEREAEQHRIGGQGTPTPSPYPAPGTVPASSPQDSAAGSPTPSEPPEASVLAESSAAYEQAHEPAPNTEKVSDGGDRPA
jgi:TatA/E family protein of Tat protein translocase